MLTCLSDLLVMCMLLAADGSDWFQMSHWGCRSHRIIVAEVTNSKDEQFLSGRGFQIRECVSNRYLYRVIKK